MYLKLVGAISLTCVFLLTNLLGCGQNPAAPQATLSVTMKTAGSVTAQALHIEALPTTSVAYYTPEVFIAQLQKIEVTQNGSSWITVWEGTQKFDLADGREVDPVGEAIVLPEGEYRGIRFTIGDDIQGQVYVDSQLYAGMLENYEGSYLFTTTNGKLTEPFVISGSGQSNLTFIFDVTDTLGYDPDMLYRSGTHWFLLKPPCTVEI